MYYLKKYIFLILVIVLIVISLFCFKEKEVEVVVNDLKKEEIEETEVVEEIIQVEKIKIDVKGAVNVPGVYELENGSRVSDAIEISGGLTKDADTSLINLSKNLKDEMVVIIYTKKEIQEMRKGTTTVKYIEKECICPEVKNDACIEESITNDDSQSEEIKDVPNGKVSLNNATLEQLMTLSGIGETKAKSIIEYREANGGFKSIDELTNVKGIGTSTYEKIKDNLTL